MAAILKKSGHLGQKWISNINQYKKLYYCAKFSISIRIRISISISISIGNVCVRSPISHYNFVKCGPIVAKLHMEVAGMIPALSRNIMGIGQRSMSPTYFHDVFLTSWWTFRHHDLFLTWWRIFFMSWRTFWRHSVLFNLTLTSWRNLCIAWCCDVIFVVMM